MPSPGVGLKHYAPRARVVLVEAKGEELGARLVAAASIEHGERVGVMLPEGMMTPQEIEPALDLLSGAGGMSRKRWRMGFMRDCGHSMRRVAR